MLGWRSPNHLISHSLAVRPPWARLLEAILKRTSTVQNHTPPAKKAKHTALAIRSQSIPSLLRSRNSSGGFWDNAAFPLLREHAYELTSARKEGKCLTSVAPGAHTIDDFRSSRPLRDPQAPSPSLRRVSRLKSFYMAREPARTWVISCKIHVSLPSLAVRVERRVLLQVRGTQLSRRTGGRTRPTSEMSSLEVIGAEMVEDPGTDMYPPTSGSNSSSSCSSAAAWGTQSDP